MGHEGNWTLEIGEKSVPEFPFQQILNCELCKTDFMEVASDIMHSGEKWTHRPENDQFRLLNILFMHPINGKLSR